MFIQSIGQSNSVFITVAVTLLLRDLT